MRYALYAFKQWLFLLLAGFVLLQLFFIGRVGFMTLVDPSSTAFERSQAWQIVSSQGRLLWRQTWMPSEQIAKPLKRAVLASEDSAFTSHNGVWWDAVEKAWSKNAKAQAKLEAQAAQKKNGKVVAPKIVGGSTITQQLAKNVFLSGERTLLRKGQELFLTLVIEHTLSKQRILEIYLNHVEWGEGIFGAEAAAQHYFQKPASQLTAWEAGRLAVMLPRPKHYQKFPQSEYLAGRTEIILTRMGSAQLP